MSGLDHELDAIAGLFHLTGRLKRLRRKGWVDRDVDDPESVADHSWRLALMTLTLASTRPDIDRERAVILALVHDLPEALTGDVTPFDDRLNEPSFDRDGLFHELPEYSQDAEEAKTASERKAMHNLTANLTDDLKTMLVDAWEEYEAGETAEANFVRQLDKLETWLQALEYQEEQPDLIIESFRRGVERDVEDPALIELMKRFGSMLRPGG